MNVGGFAVGTSDLTAWAWLVRIRIKRIKRSGVCHSRAGRLGDSPVESGNPQPRAVSPGELDARLRGHDRNRRGVDERARGADGMRWVIAACGIAALASAAAPGAGIPCSYQVSAIIQAPYCDPFGYPPTFGTPGYTYSIHLLGYLRIRSCGRSLQNLRQSECQPWMRVVWPDGD
jgi:hypothetical protein